MDPIHIFFIVLAGIIALIIIGIITSANAKKNLYYKMLSHYGQVDTTEYTYEEFECISHFYKNTLKDEFHIDDTTWNDLNMDNIYLLINHTNSSVGREYLYKLLRTPVFDEDILKERERLIQYLDSHDDERTKIMVSMRGIGFTRKISVSDYMENLVKLKPASNAFHYIIIFMVIASICFMIFVDPVIGIAMVLGSMGTAIVSYYKIKSRIENYFSCIRQLVSMVQAGKEIAAINAEELKEYNKFFNETGKKFAKVTRNSFLLVSSKENSGSLIDMVMEYIRMFTHVDLIKFNNMLKKIGNCYDDVLGLMNRLGLIDSMISVANFRKVIPYYCNPEFADNTGINLKEVYHLSIKEPVANSINNKKPVMVTGSNASGKSTFLKSVAINALLAQTINTCPSTEYKAPFYRIYSSMALSDNLEAGDSYYIVEIKSLKRIVDASKENGAQILCFVDEVLRGTNTVERISASSQILKDLAQNNVQCFAATHDIELTYILERYYANYHFTEQVVDNEVVFSYEIQDGRATSRNAIKLLEIIGYDKSIVEKATERANDFINTGVWREI